MSEIEVIYLRLITLVILCLGTLALGFNVLHVPGYTLGIAVLVMLVFGRWRLYALQPWLFRHRDQLSDRRAPSHAE